MLNEIWPLMGLRVRTPVIELRYPTEAELAELGALAAAGIHDPAVQPFSAAWTDIPPEDVARAVLTYHWQQRASVRPTDWSLGLIAFHEGIFVGTQGLSATNFAILREVETGSWLGQRFQGRGLGTHLRAAALALAFTGLGADYATSGAFTDNAASNGVSAKFGYRPDGIMRLAIRGQAATLQRYRLSRADWTASPTQAAIPVTIDGLTAALPLLGAD